MKNICKNLQTLNQTKTKALNFLKNEMNNYQTIIVPKVEELIQNNHKLVKKIAWHLHGRVQSIIDIEDLIQIGMIGLISAAQNYTPVKNASFSAYASLRIRGEILDFLRKKF